MDASTLVFLGFGLLVVAATIWNSRRPSLGNSPTNKELLDKVTELLKENSELKSLVISLRAELQELRTAEIGALKREVIRLNAILLGNNVQPGANRPRGGTEATTSSPPLLLVMGPDEMIRQRELNALRQSGIDFRVCQGADGKGATFADLIAELNRRRNDDTLPRYIVFALHGGEAEIDGQLEGVLALRDRAVSWREIANQLSDVEIVVLSSCATTRLADQLAGIVGHVVSFSEAVQNEDALRFDRIFWTAIREGKVIDAAYAEARKAVVGIRQFADLQ